MTKWEYLNVTIKTGLFAGGPKEVTSKLNEDGDEGWELVDFQVLDDGLMCFIFKRIKNI